MWGNADLWGSGHRVQGSIDACRAASCPILIRPPHDFPVGDAVQAQVVECARGLGIGDNVGSAGCSVTDR